VKSERLTGKQLWQWNYAGMIKLGRIEGGERRGKKKRIEKKAHTPVVKQRQTNGEKKNPTKTKIKGLMAEKGLKMKK